MLTHLGIQGLAIIESLNIEFAHGFNVITGETGAGKSILIKALSLLLGGKSSPESVRKGFEQATVSGRFLVRKNHPALSLLTELGVTAEEEEHGFGVIVRRLVTSKGRSSAWINDTPVTTTSLKQLSETLIDIFGQHDNHRLLDVAFHSHYLDQFIKTKTLPKSLEDKWRETSHLLSDLRSFIEKLRGSGQESDYLSYRLSELRTFNPTDEDYKSMLGLNERAKSALGMTSAIQHAMSALEDESGFSVAKRVREVARALVNSKVSTLVEIASEASKIAESLDELSYSIGKVSANVDVSEEDIDAAETRIAGYQALFRKNAATDVESLVAEWNKLEAQMAALSDATGHIEALVSKFESLVEEVLVIAKKLTLERAAAVDIICKRVEAELTDLAMPGAKFSVEMDPVVRPAVSLDVSHFSSQLQNKWVDILEKWTCVGEHGAEKAQFYLSSNAGEPSLPLTKIASGGEISRIMLALKKALVVGAETCVLVFDEIDTGISGRIADTVGRKIAELAEFCQIICISHLPQVAAFADTHYIVEKKAKGERTESTIRLVESEERFEELARLLSGNKVTTASLTHAKNLVVEAHSKVKAPAVAAATRKKSKASK